MRGGGDSPGVDRIDHEKTVRSLECTVQDAVALFPPVVIQHAARADLSDATEAARTGADLEVMEVKYLDLDILYFPAVSQPFP